ncbi:uncharacterized protein BYT42DRAFT_15226 [Radiomyces spectabilis]|uniref:uncharacterized protein n=1 Tax=Radiomyces spectabilis TaxID=64574 RepID=UPI00221E6BD2|nr:uncharacterized protein BYT42DRAFT_15226 [Radiomyces spectabilis]KAI8393677.1 hypothetical protein BYT42DRAFT_15226 [Radiomyces spectabilis]
MLASSERAQMTDRNVPTNLVMCIGNAGTGVGSRIRGHARRGGKKMRTEHSKNTTVAITNEFCSSKTCVFCFQQTELTKRSLPDGKTKQVLGAVRCINPDCPAVQRGHATRNRDQQAAFAIWSGRCGPNAFEEQHDLVTLRSTAAKQRQYVIQNE